MLSVLRALPVMIAMFAVRRACEKVTEQPWYHSLMAPKRVWYERPAERATEFKFEKEFLDPQYTLCPIKV